MIGFFLNKRRQYAQLIARGFVLFWIAAAVAPCVNAAAWSGAATAMPCHEMMAGDAASNCDGCGLGALNGAWNCETAEQALNITPDVAQYPRAPILIVLQRVAVKMAPRPPLAELAADTHSPEPPLHSRPHILRS